SQFKTVHGADGVLVLESSFFTTHRPQIVMLANTSRLPAIYWTREFAEEGGLMSYGLHFKDLYRRAGTYADKILKGAKPADLPVEQPTTLEPVVNLKTVAVGKARERRIRDESVKLQRSPAGEIPAWSKPSRQASSECCLSPGDWRVRSVHSKEAGREGSAPTSDMIATST